MSQLCRGRKSRVALLGGAFNPPHLGHINIAESVLNAGFDEAWLTPCFRHLYGKRMAEDGYRLAMCEMAAANHPKVKVFDFEIKHRLSGSAYEFIERLSHDPLWCRHEFFYVVGMDNANTIHQWHEYKKLLKMIPFIVVPRHGVKPHTHVPWYTNPPHVVVRAEFPSISSTQVRELVRAHIDVDELTKFIDFSVYSYIVGNGMYEEEEL